MESIGSALMPLHAIAWGEIALGYLGVGTGINVSTLPHLISFHLISNCRQTNKYRAQVLYACY